MAAEQALSKLLDVSDAVVAAVILDREAAVVAATVDDEAAAKAAAVAGAMLSFADTLRAEPTAGRIRATTRDATVFVVRDGDRAIVAAVEPDALEGLVLHDLRTCLRESGKRVKEQATA